MSRAVSTLLVFGPLAILTGVLALRDIGRRPHLRGRGRAWFGIIAGGLGSAGLLLVLISAG